jgi:L-lactate dehydrogenase complex protein LldG
VVARPAVSAREEILARIRTALADVPAGEEPADVPVPRDYERGARGIAVERFVERVTDYGTTVVRTTREAAAATIAARCAARGARRLAVPGDLPAAWAPRGVDLTPETALDPGGLDRLDGALTGCALAIAETGTIVLDGGRHQGTRALTLVPDLHICVLDAEQVAGGVPEAFTRLAPALRATRRAITFVSGPSATSDIELSRVEGVHGPRTLDVVLVDRST